MLCSKACGQEFCLWSFNKRIISSVLATASQWANKSYWTFWNCFTVWRSLTISTSNSAWNYSCNSYNSLKRLQAELVPQMLASMSREGVSGVVNVLRMLYFWLYQEKTRWAELGSGVWGVGLDLWTQNQRCVKDEGVVWGIPCSPSLPRCFQWGKTLQLWFVSSTGPWLCFIWGTTFHVDTV